MKSHRKALSLLMCAFFIAATATAAFAQTSGSTTGQCAFQTLNFPAPANRLPVPRALNDVGAIVGSYFGGNTSHGFLLYQGHLASFMFPGSTRTEPWDISRTGIIVGTYNVSGVLGTRAFMVKSGVFHQITFPGFPATSASAFGVNSNGDVVGDFLSNGTAFGYLLRNGKVTILSFPGAKAGTTPTSINDEGVVVGNYFLAPFDGGHAFMWKDGVFSNVTPFGSTFSLASKISNTGVVVGSYVSDGLRHGYAFKNGTYTKIDLSPTVGSLVDAVNKFDNVIAEKIEGSVDPLFKGFCSAAF
jgi:uncharacterized membrane protein